LHQIFSLHQIIFQDTEKRFYEQSTLVSKSNFNTFNQNFEKL